MAPKSKKKPPTTSCDGHESIQGSEGTATPQNAEIAHREDLEFVLLAPLSRPDAHVRIKRVEGGHDGLEALGGLFCRVMFIQLALGGLHLCVSGGGCPLGLLAACARVSHVLVGDECVLGASRRPQRRSVCRAAWREPRVALRPGQLQAGAGPEPKPAARRRAGAADAMAPRNDRVRKRC